MRGRRVLAVLVMAVGILGGTASAQRSASPATLKPVAADLAGLPLLDDVAAASLTPMQLHDVLAARLAEYLPSPVVSVIVNDAHQLQGVGHRRGTQTRAV